MTASAGSFGNVGTFNYGYVGNTGILSRMDRPNGTSTLLSYENLQDPNSLHRLTGVQDVNTASGANIAGFGYGYDSPGTQNGFLDNRTSQTRAYESEAAQTISYGYNPTSMLQGEGAAQGSASTPALSKSYSFDAMGNRTGFSDAVAKTQVTSTYNNLNQLTGQNLFSTASGQAVATGSSAFGYDGDGNMSFVSAKDAGGAVTSQTSYSYDDASRLIGITTPGSSKWQFVYDGRSRLRISRSWNWQNNGWVQTSEKRRVYLGMSVVQERDANNNVIASYSGGLARSTATGTVFYGYDGSGNITTLTDGTGAVVGSYTYDAWGNIIASSGPKAQENPYRYFGKEQLAGYYFYGYRFYSSGLGRWINRDPIQEAGASNVYAFVGNNPVNHVDRFGLNAEDNLDEANTTYNGASKSGGGVIQLPSPPTGYSETQPSGGEASSAGSVEMPMTMDVPSTPLLDIPEGLQEPHVFDLQQATSGPNTFDPLDPFGVDHSYCPNDVPAPDLTDEWDTAGYLKQVGKTKGNFGAGETDHASALEIGKNWVGDNHTVTQGGKIWISQDGTKQFRLPSFKPGMGLSQSNLEWRYPGLRGVSPPEGKWMGNGHIYIR